MQKGPSAAHSIARNIGFRKGDNLGESPSFQTVPFPWVSAKMADNTPVFPAFFTPAVSVAESCSADAGKDAVGDAALLYLKRNNTTEVPAACSSAPVECTENLCNILSSYHRKAAHALSLNVSALVNAVGLERLGFLTLTFPDNVVDFKEAYQRFNSLNVHYIKKHPDFGPWLCVKERQQRGAWHYHLLIDCGGDIRSGLDWEQIRKGNYRSANERLRSLWADLRANLSKYGFGRSELLPVRSNVQAVSRYVGKYISKHVGARKAEDKGVRLCSYSHNWPRSNSNFQWNNQNAKKWRENVSNLAGFLDCTFEQMTFRLGRRWAWRYREEISKGIIPLEVREEILAEHEARHKWQKRYRLLTEVQPRGAAGPLSATCCDQHAAAAASSIKMPRARYRASFWAISKSTGGT